MSNENKSANENVNETLNQDTKEITVDNKIIEAVVAKFQAIGKKHGYVITPSQITPEVVAHFAAKGFEAKMYRRKYNKNRWSQLKALKEALEDRGISIKDLLSDEAE